MNSHPGGEKDGCKGSAFRIGPEEKESHPLSSWGEGGKRKCMKTGEFVAAENVLCLFSLATPGCIFPLFCSFLLIGFVCFVSFYVDLSAVSNRPSLVLMRPPLAVAPRTSILEMGWL